MCLHVPRLAEEDRSLKKFRGGLLFSAKSWQYLLAAMHLMQDVQ